MPLLKAGGQVFEEGAISSSEGTQVSSAGTNHTKGSFVQLIASTSYTYGGLLIILGGFNTSGRHFLVDIAIGAAASEQVIIPNIYIYSQQDSTFGHAYVPMMIPQGSRISARCQSSTASNYVRVNVIGIAGEGLATDAVTYGADTATSSGVTVNSNASANTKGSWTQLTAATTRSHQWGIFCVRAAGNSQYVFDIGIGGSGSEQLLVPNLNVRDSSSGDPAIYSFPLRIPNGTRVACRSASATGNLGASVSLTMI